MGKLIRSLEDLSAAEPGDRVVISVNGIRPKFCTGYVAGTVERLTKTQVILKGRSRKFRLRDGREVGGAPYTSSHIVLSRGGGISVDKVLEKALVGASRMRAHAELQRAIDLLGDADWSSVDHIRAKLEMWNSERERGQRAREKAKAIREKAKAKSPFN